MKTFWRLLTCLLVACDGTPSPNGGAPDEPSSADGGAAPADECPEYPTTGGKITLRRGSPP